MLVDRRSKNGQSLIELSAGLLVAIPIFLAVLYGIAIGIGYQTNEKTCTEAARVAANSDPSLAESRVQSILYRANQEKAWMTANLYLVSINNLVNPTGVEQSDGSIPFSTVEVTTAVQIQPFFLSDLISKHKFLTLISTHSFPYTYLPNPEALQSSSN